MLPNGMDIAVLVILGIFVFFGWKNGLVKMGIRLCSFVVALGCAWMFHPFLADFLRKTPWVEKILSPAAVGKEPVPAVPGTAEEWGSMAGNAVTEYLTGLLLNGISFLVILVLVRLLLFVLGKVLHLVASLPVLGFFNRLAGMTLGILEGLLVVWVLMAVLAVVPPLRENKPLGYAIEQSVFARDLYRHNFVLDALMPETEELAEHETERMVRDEEIS